MFIFLDENGLSTWEWKKFDRNQRSILIKYFHVINTLIKFFLFIISINQSKVKRIINFTLKDTKSKINLVNIIYGSIHNCYFALRADNVIIV